jgi:hypothetical protein
MEERRKLCRIFVGKREDIIKMNLKEIGYDGMDWIQMALGTV